MMNIIHLKCLIIITSLLVWWGIAAAIAAAIAIAIAAAGAAEFLRDRLIGRVGYHETHEGAVVNIKEFICHPVPHHGARIAGWSNRVVQVFQVSQRRDDLQLVLENRDVTGFLQVFFLHAVKM